MLRLLNKAGKGPQKKLISFQNPVLVDGMIKAEAAMYNITDSCVVERTLTDHYFNPNDQITTATASNLFSDNGMMLTLKAVTQIYIEHPEYANGTLLNLLRYASRLCLIYPTDLKTTDAGIKEFADLASKMLAIIEKRLAADPTYTFLNAEGENLIHVDEFSLIALRDIAEAPSSQRKLTTENLLYLGINSIITFWNFGDGGDISSPTLKNWKGTYLFLDSILGLCHWDDYLPSKYEFSQLVKKITFDTGEQGTFNASAPALDKLVCLYKKSFMTTKDAIILRTQEGQDDGFFTGAYRIMHGPGVQMTKRPYIILFKNESDAEITSIVEELLKDHSEEFPDPKDFYVVQFMWNGIYYDKRILWKTV